MEIEGKKVIGEVCKCGHLKIQHSSSVASLGHGPCRLCDCKKFTWVKFLFEGEEWEPLDFPPIVKRDAP